MEICSDGKCCNTGVLNKPGNDFERNDWTTFRANEISEDCHDFKINTDNVNATIAANSTALLPYEVLFHDAICINKYVS